MLQWKMTFKHKQADHSDDHSDGVEGTTLLTVPAGGTQGLQPTWADRVQTRPWEKTAVSFRENSLSGLQLPARCPAPWSSSPLGQPQARASQQSPSVCPCLLNTAG